MAYEKRLCVLKQLKKGFTADGSPLSGVVYAERLGSELIITPRLMAIAPVKEGRYAFSVWVNGSIFVLEMTDGALKVQDAPSLQSGFAVLLCLCRMGEVEPVAFGSCGSAPVSYEGLLASLVNAAPSGKKGQSSKQKKPLPPMPVPPFEQPVPTNPQLPHAPQPPLPEEDCFRGGLAAGVYDDEAISATNYYEPQTEVYEDEASDKGDQAKKDAVRSAACADEADDAVHPFQSDGGSLTYYNKVREKLEATMKRYPPDDRLRGIFPESDWVDADGMLLGIIYEEGRPRYLCVAAKTQGALPAQMEEAGICVPVSVFSGAEEFYIAFQDADTGEYARVFDA